MLKNIGVFNNIGKKIKKLAEIFAIIGIILSIFLGINDIANYVELGSSAQSQNKYILFAGIFWLIIGPIVSWIASFCLYGFGELVDKICDIQTVVCNGNIFVADSPKNQKCEEDEKSLRQGLIIQAECDGIKEQQDYVIKSDVTPIFVPDDKMKCPICGFIQPKGRTVCWQCGAKFKDE